MKIKIYVLIHNRCEGFEERDVEIGFKKLKDAKKYLKNMITEILMDLFEYTKGINDKEFKEDYKDTEKDYSIEEIELR